MFFDWKIQLEKVQITRDLKYDTMIYQGKRLTCKNDREYCDPTTATQATVVWFPEDTYHISSCKNTLKNDKISSKLL